MPRHCRPYDTAFEARSRSCRGMAGAGQRAGSTGPPRGSAPRRSMAALKLRPDGAEMWKGRGELLMTLGRYDEAISAFASALHA